MAKSGYSAKNKTPAQIWGDLESKVKSMNGVLITPFPQNFNMSVKVEIKCLNDNHTYTTSVNSILYFDRKCPTCINRQPRRTPSQIWETLEEVVAAKGGKLLTPFSAYTTVFTKIKIECLTHKTIWDTTVHSILNLGTWCFQCAVDSRAAKKLKTVNTWQKVVDYVDSRGGVLVTKEEDYKGTHSRVEVKCSCGAVFSASANNLIYQKQWCPVCNTGKLRRSKKSVWDRLNEIISAKGGKLLTKKDEYQNSLTRVKVQCEHGHIWETSASNIVYVKSWCPECYEVRKSLPRAKRKV